MSQLLEKAEKAYRKKNFDYAITLWLQHLKLKPEDVECRQMLRKCARDREALKPKGGLGSWLKKAKGAVTANIPISSKDPEGTMNSCEEALKNDPSSAPILFRLGEASALAGHNETAAWVFADILSIHKGHKEALRHGARVHRELGSFDKAIAYYEKLRQIAPSDAEAQNGVRDLAARTTSRSMQEKTAGGGGYRALIDKDKASKLQRGSQRIRTSEQAQERMLDLKEELENDPDNAKIMAQMAEMHLICKESAEAKNWYEKAVAADPDVFDYQEKLGDLRIQQYDQAIAKLKVTARNDPSAKAKLEKYTRERLKVMIKEYQERVEAQPTESKYAFQLGKTLHEAGQYDAAIPELQKAKSDSKFRTEAGYYLGLTLFKKKNARLAIKELEGARADIFDMDDDMNKQITYLIGRIYEMADKKEKALVEFEKIAEVDYGYRDIQKRLESMGGL